MFQIYWRVFPVYYQVHLPKDIELRSMSREKLGKNNIYGNLKSFQNITSLRIDDKKLISLHFAYMLQYKRPEFQ